MYKIETKDLCLSFGKTKVLNHVSIGFQRHKITALIGPTGNGKTSFLKTLNRMVEL
ncbi:MAG: ATP-binding cassette domain-containing protein [Bacteroidia bacterium]|nr:ATP-binding cassette domain-containing protein [Bacteroidia bacterium]